MFVRPVLVCLKLSIFIFWAQDDFRMTPSTQKALREHLKSTQRAREQSDFFIPSKPKILRLVYIDKNYQYNQAK